MDTCVHGWQGWRDIAESAGIREGQTLLLKFDKATGYLHITVTMESDADASFRSVSLKPQIALGSAPLGEPLNPVSRPSQAGFTEDVFAGMV